MVLCGGLVQTDMGLNLIQRLCVLSMVYEVIENRLDSVGSMSRMVVRREEERGGSIVLDVYQTGGNDVWTPVSMASYWL